jgi:hypothetical protein
LALDTEAINPATAPSAAETASDKVSQFFATAWLVGKIRTDEITVERKIDFDLFM